jgi:trigger factor
MTTEVPEASIRVERRPQSLVAISVEVPAERVEQAAEKAFRRLVQKVNIPGFRPGKAPRALYERQYGSTHLYDEAARDLVEEYYRQAVDANDLHPLGSPDVEISRLGKGEPLVFEATVPVRPPVELGDYRAHGQKVEPKAVTDEEVEKVVAGMREHHAELRPVQRPAQSGDVLTVDIDATLDGKALPPFGRNAHIEVGREYAINGLSQGLLGASEGDTRTLELDFPPDYQDADVRGKKGVFAVKVHQVSEKVLPELDDEFAKTVGVQDLGTLRKTVRGELAHAAFHEGRDEAAEHALGHAIDTAKVDVPDILVDDELDHMLADLKDRLRQQGLSYEEFLLRAKKTEDEVRAEWRDAARRRATSMLVLDEIAKREDVGVTSDELAQELANIPLDPQNPQAIRDPRVLSALARSLRNRKVMDRLIGIDSADMERQLLAQAGAIEEANAGAAAEAGTEAPTS